MNLNYKKIKDIKISFDKKEWDAELYNILITFDIKNKKFKIKMIKNIYKEIEVLNLREANNILKKFQLK